jgi:hypothetical protein
MRKSKLPINEILFILGCIGAAEIIITSFFWHQIMTEKSLMLFRPGHLFAQLSMTGVLIGLLGSIIFFYRCTIRLFKEKEKIGLLATSLFLLFFAEFVWVVYLGTGV